MKVTAYRNSILDLRKTYSTGSPKLGVIVFQVIDLGDDRLKRVNVKVLEGKTFTNGCEGYAGAIANHDMIGNLFTGGQSFGCGPVVFVDYTDEDPFIVTLDCTLRLRHDLSIHTTNQAAYAYWCFSNPQWTPLSLEANALNVMLTSNNVGLRSFGQALHQDIPLVGESDWDSTISLAQEIKHVEFQPGEAR